MDGQLAYTIYCSHCTHMKCLMWTGHNLSTVYHTYTHMHKFNIHVAWLMVSLSKPFLIVHDWRNFLCVLHICIYIALCTCEYITGALSFLPLYINLYAWCKVHHNTCPLHWGTTYSLLLSQHSNFLLFHSIPLSKLICQPHHVSVTKSKVSSAFSFSESVYKRSF